MPWWAAACFLLSGAAGLIHEIAWSKQLGYLLGSSLQSVATVTAAFLAGLALGARFLGARLARRSDPARVYAALEVGVAVLGLAMLPVLRSLDGPVGLLYRGLGGEGTPFALARVVLLFVLLVPPAALMGATLPVLVARCERGALGAGLAWLYAINTIGAVLGSLLAGFVLLPGIGLFASVAVAAGLNLLAAVVAFVQKPAPAAARTPVAAEVPRLVLLSPSARRVVGLMFALSGFAALALQLAWVRLYSLILGSSVYSFAGVLGVYLAGIALGSALVGPWLARMASPGGFALLQSALAASVLVGLRADHDLPRAMLELGERMGTSWGGLVFAQLGLVLPVVFVPCVLLGALFPVTTRLLQTGGGAEATGHAYALNTLGTIAGSLVTGFVLLPWLGVHGVVNLAACIAGAIAVLALALPGMGFPTARTSALVSAFVALALLASATLPKWDPVLMSLGTYRPFSAQNLMTSFRSAGGVGDPTRAVSSAQKVLFYREGINASVLVASDLEDRRRWMRVGGKIDAGTGDMLTQVLVGLLPACMADTGARTLIVGHGSGATAAAALAAGVGSTDIVELEPAVIAASRFFHEGRPDPLDDPRVTLHLEDARTQLAHGAGQYDLIISEPTNPWIAGVNALFTTDFYRRVRTRLAPDGVFCQWIQIYELSPESWFSLLSSYVEVFPDAQLFCLWRSSDVILISAPKGRTLAYDRITAASVEPALREARLADAIDIAAFAAGPAAAARAHAASATLNTDDHPFVEYRAPRDLVEVGRAKASPHPDVVASLTRTLALPAGSPLADWPRERVLAVRARAMLADRGDIDPAPVVAELRSLGMAALADSVRAEHVTRVRSAYGQQLSAQLREASARGDAQAARTALEQLATIDAATPEMWGALAAARLDAGDRDGAAAAAARALRGLAGAARAPVLLVAGTVAWNQGRHAEALVHAAAFEALVPQDARGYDLEARVRLAQGDRAGALRAVERGLVQAPADASLLTARRALTAAPAR
ncbi:MAG: fused MFS/spermidine synthase [Candidatus Eisenbacteria bacterium]|nr:fused MFS/spermidine synthase [Candidatus Eisenbacteria bacterium]